MAILSAIALLFCSSYALTEGTEYIMVELEPALYERSIVKRQVQYAQDPRAVQYSQDPRGVQYAQDPRGAVQYTQDPRAAVQYTQDPRAAQYAAQQGAEQQIPPEYINYLQQLQAQQIQAQQLQAQQGQIPADVQQSLSSRAPQSFQQPQIVRQSPVSEEQRRLQESLAQAPLLEQEREDQTNQQLIALGLNPTQVRRQRLRESAERLALQQAQEQAARQAFQAAEQHQQLVYPQQQVVQPHLVQVPQAIPVQQQAEAATPSPERVSYSQIAFGSTKLPQQRILPGQTQLIYAQPNPAQAQLQHPAYRQQAQQPQVIYQPQLVYRQERERSPQAQLIYRQEQERSPQPQQFVYTQEADSPTYSTLGETPQAFSYQPQVRYVQSQPQTQQAQRQPQAKVTQKQTPEQYLIETTKKEPQQRVLNIPRKQQVSYRPQPNYEGLQAALAAQQQRTRLAQQQSEASTTPAPRSSIFVTTSRTPTPKAYTAPEYRIPTPEGQRPLTQSELNALINAGFSVSPSGQSYGQEYFRGFTKRQNVRPRIGRVPLSQEEREALAKNGIRSLYRVQTAETQDAPVTYVLAIENQKRDTEKSTTS